MAQLNAGCSRGHHTYVLVVNETAIDTAANTSTVSFSIRLDGTNSYNWAGWGSSIGCNYSINGTTRTITIPQWGSGYSPSSGVVIQSGTQVIPHNEDGTKTITLSISGFDNTGQSYTPGTASNSMTMTLTPIEVSKDMNIRIGDNVIKKAYVGTAEVKEIFFGETNIFPGYTKLEYIQSTGSQYINTGIQTNSNNFDKIEFRFKDNTTVGTSEAILFGAYEGLMLGKATYNQSSYTYTVATSGEWKKASPVITPNSNINTYIYDNGQNYINSTMFFNSTVANTNKDMLICKVNGFSPSANEKINVYSFKISKNNNLIRDFIPVKRKTDNKVGLYDLVEHKFYGNSGSGDFTAGPEI